MISPTPLSNQGFKTSREKSGDQQPITITGKVFILDSEVYVKLLKYSYLISNKRIISSCSTILAHLSYGNTNR